MPAKALNQNLSPLNALARAAIMAANIYQLKP